MPRLPDTIVLIALSLPACVFAADPPALTTLSDRTIKYKVPGKPYIILKRGEVEAVIVENSAVDDDVLPGHRAGYSGVASLKHTKSGGNLFVPAYAGLNFEHIHDGRTLDRDILFEPRRAPMELRVINEHTAELHQKPTPTWGLESCHRYALLEDGTIEMTFECIPRRDTYKNGYIGLFWASYIHEPKSLGIHFIGRRRDAADDDFGWVETTTPQHGVVPTHIAPDDKRNFAHDDDFPLSLVFNQSEHYFERPWYFGVSRGGDTPMAFAQIFRAKDRIRITQSPSGGGRGNPAWDFQFFIEDYKLDQRYQLVMRAKIAPFESREQMRKLIEPHFRALNPVSD